MKSFESFVSRIESAEGDESPIETLSGEKKSSPESLISKSKRLLKSAAEVGGVAFDFLNYKLMKLKENLGNIGEEEFDQLLAIDFKNELEDNAPIDGLFSPENDLKRISGLPHGEKRKALKEFKNKTERQRQAWAMCRVFIERRIEQNHDVQKDSLMAEIARFASEYGFTEDQNKSAEDMIDGYYEQRQKVKDLLEKYSNRADLVQALCGEALENSDGLVVEMGPMSIDIEAGSLDTVKMRGSEHFKWWNAPNLAGFAAVAECDSSVYYTVISNNPLSHLESWGSTDKTRRHEWEHQKNRLFRDFFEKEMTEEEEEKLLEDYDAEPDQETKEVLLSEYFNRIQQRLLFRVRDEIIARLQTEKFKEGEISGLREKFSSYGDYDFITELEDKSRDGDSLWQKCFRNIIRIEYRKIIENALRAFTSLVNRGQFSRFSKLSELTNQEAIALLTDKSLEDWPKTVKRFLNQKLINHSAAKTTEANTESD